MTTLADLSAAIADDIDATNGEYGSQITSAIQTAIRYCERHLFYFNETRDQTFATVPGQEWYDAAANANIPTLVRLQTAYVIDNGNQITEMVRATPEGLEILSDASSSTGRPTNYVYYGQKIRLYPVPDAGPYTIRLQLGPYRLTPLSQPSDTSAWLDEAYDMVKARAKYILHKDTLKEPALAAEALNDYNDQFAALKAETAKRSGTGCIVPTQF